MGAFFPPGAWYASLNKPRWNPPNWIFGPVWTILYIMMGTAAGLIHRRVPTVAGSETALIVFFVQLALNAAWTPIFFGLHSLGGALVVIVLMWFAIGGSIVAFLHVDRVAGLLLVPYLLWVTFATALNAELWRLNFDAKGR